jgi:hypothetical protein
MQTQVKDRLMALQREINFRENEISKINKEITDKSGELSKATISSQING